MDESVNPFLVTLRLPIVRPRIITKLLILAYLLALTAPWLSSIGLIFKLILVFFPIFGLWRLLYKYRFSSVKERVVELVLGTEDDWQVKLNNEAVFDACLADSLFVHPLLTIILLKYDGREEYFIFTPDNIAPDLFRRLRVRLRFKLENRYAAK